MDEHGALTTLASESFFFESNRDERTIFSLVMRGSGTISHGLNIIVCFPRLSVKICRASRAQITAGKRLPVGSH